MDRWGLRGGRVLVGEAIRPALVLVEDGRIASVRPGRAQAPAGVAVRDLPEGSILSPGFVDAQANGGGGVLFNDHPEAGAALAIAAAHRRFGTTSLLPTLITDTPGRMRAAADAAREAMAADAGVAGLHLEGPYLSPLRPGVHPPALIRPPEPGELDWLAELAASFGGALLLTVAPEVMPPGAIGRLSQAGVLVCAGHTEASLAQMRAALDEGLRGWTHLGNAMPPMAARAPGPVGAALADGRGWCGMIADGEHVDPAFLGLVARARPRGRVVLVTDAMPVVGTDADGFSLGGVRISRRGGRLETADGVLAGADLHMAQAVRVAQARAGIGLAEALLMASSWPAAFLGLDDRGRIEPGLRADLVLLDGSLRVSGTWLGGRWLAGG